MIFYEGKKQSDVICAAISDHTWSDEERKALMTILNYVKGSEKNQAIMVSDRWINDPVLLPDPPHSNIVFHGKWVNGQDTYTTSGMKFMLEDAGTGWRIGRCY